MGQCAAIAAVFTASGGIGRVYALESVRCVPCRAGRAVLTGHSSKGEQCTPAAHLGSDRLCESCRKHGESLAHTLQQHGPSAVDAWQLLLVVEALLNFNLTRTAGSSAGRGMKPGLLDGLGTEIAHNCLETMPELALGLVGWLFLISPQWGLPSLRNFDRRSATLFERLEKLIGGKRIELRDSIPALQYGVMAPANDAATNVLTEIVNGFCAYNFYDRTRKCGPHHSVFNNFLPAGITNDYENGYVVDFLGVRHEAAYFATLEQGSDKGTSPTTRVAAARSYSDRSLTPAPWPLVDEEYFQHIDVLTAVLEASKAGLGIFTAVELGTSSLAPWASKAVAAWRRLVPHGVCRVGLAEVNEVAASKLEQSLGRLGLEGCSGTVWNVDVRLDGLPALLGGLGTIDYLDIDIEGGEFLVLSSARAFLRERVRLLHIGTHARYIHYNLERLLREDGWELLWSFPGRSYTQTPFGRVAFLDGVLAAISPTAQNLQRRPATD